jgi:hypothetical protein
MSSGDITAIDRANRQFLDDLEREYRRLPAGQVRTDRLADIAGIREALKTRDSHLVYLARPDDPSQMIPATTAIGDPFNADRVSVTVPGVGSTTRQSIDTMTREALSCSLRLRTSVRRSVITVPCRRLRGWGISPRRHSCLGTRPPTPWRRRGAPKLESFLSDLNAATHNPGHTTALFGRPIADAVEFGAPFSAEEFTTAAGIVRQEAAKYGATTESSLFNESAKRDYDVQGNGYEFDLGQIKVATLVIKGDCFLLQNVLDLPPGQLPPEPSVIPTTP